MSACNPPPGSSWVIAPESCPTDTEGCMTAFLMSIAQAAAQYSQAQWQRCCISAANQVGSTGSVALLPTPKDAAALLWQRGMAQRVTPGAPQHALALLEKRLLEAAQWGDKELTVELVDHYKGINISCTDQVGRTALHIAAQAGNWQVVQLLAARGALLDAVDCHGKTPLHVAARTGHYWVAHYLLRAHPAPSMLLELLDHHGQSPLHAAALGGSMQLLQQLLKVAAPHIVDYADQVGHTPLMIASMMGHNNLVQILLAHGANPDTVDKVGRTALHCAVYHNSTHVVKCLLASAANPELVDKDGRTAAHAAVHVSHADILAELLAGGASTAVLDSQGRTLLQAAEYMGNEAAVQLIQGYTQKSARSGMTTLASTQAQPTGAARRSVPRVFVFPAASSTAQMASQANGQKTPAVSAETIQPAAALAEGWPAGAAPTPAAGPPAQSPPTPVAAATAAGQETQAVRRPVPASAFAGFCPPGMEPPPPAISDGSSDAGSTCHWTSAELSLPVPVSLIEVEPDDLPEGRRVGEGAFGVVYKCRWLGRSVAIKRFAGRGLSPSVLRSFKTEVSTLSRLQHPNVVEFLGASVKPPRLAIVTEYVSNGSLFHLLHSTKHCVLVEPRRRLSIARDVAAALAYLHSCQPPIVHRDLKSANILISSDWTAKVADFGMSQLLRDAFLSARSQLGTSAWAAPEAFTNQDLCEKCDVFSFGVVLWELATGMIPWQGVSHHQITMAVAVNGLQLEIPMDVDPQLACLIRECWHMQPSQRPTFKEVHARLGAMTEIKPSVLTQQPLPPTPGTAATAFMAPQQTSTSCMPQPGTPSPTHTGPTHMSDAAEHAPAAAAVPAAAPLSVEAAAAAPQPMGATPALHSALAAAAMAASTAASVAAAAATAAASRAMAMQPAGWANLVHQFTGHVCRSAGSHPCLARISAASSAMSRATTSSISDEDRTSTCTIVQPEDLDVDAWSKAGVLQGSQQDSKGASAGGVDNKILKQQLAPPSPLFIETVAAEGKQRGGDTGLTKERTSCCCSLWSCIAK